jgi:hypothetical protein
MSLKDQSLLTDGMIGFALLTAVAFLLMIFSSARLP